MVWSMEKSLVFVCGYPDENYLRWKNTGCVNIRLDTMKEITVKLEK